MQFYAVKSLYRWKINDVLVSNIEERIVLFRAKNFDSAIKKAEREAGRYTNRSYKNIDGKNVKFENLGYYNAFLILDEFKEGSELFSATTLLKQKITSKLIIKKAIDLDQILSKSEKKSLQELFFRGEY